MYQKIRLNESESIIVECSPNWSDISIIKNGVLIGAFKDGNELKVARLLRSPDGQEYTAVITDHGLEIWHNGKELISEATSGQIQPSGFSIATRVLLSIGAYYIVISIVNFFTDSSHTSAAILLGMGTLILGLSLWAQHTGSKMPFRLALVLCAFNLARAIMNIWLPGCLLSIILGYYLIKGIQSKSPLELISKMAFDPDAPLDSNL